jgi:threonine/homoserine/homoserine lactone efflux protein
MLIERLPIFVLVTFVVLVVPGPDFVLVTRNALVSGRRGGYFTALGICTGLALLTILTASGVTAIVTASPAMLTVLRVLGGCYLIALALLFLRSAYGRSRRQAETSDHAVPAGRRSPVLQGFLNNVLNPKALIFFLTFMPQFIGSGMPIFAQTVLLGVVVVFCAATWWSVYIAALGRMSMLLRRRAVLTAIDSGGGIALGALGVLIIMGSL